MTTLERRISEALNVVGDTLLDNAVEGCTSLDDLTGAVSRLTEIIAAQTLVEHGGDSDVLLEWMDEPEAVVEA